MPRVVPSEVVRFIDRAFPWAALPTEPASKLGIAELGRTRAILHLVDQIPDALLVLPPGNYADLIGFTAQLRATSELVVSHGSSYTFKSKHVWFVRNLLQECPDEVAAAGIPTLQFVVDQNLREDLRRDVTEAYRGLSDGSWKAATVLAGSVIEALLVVTLRTIPADARATAIVQGMQEEKRRPIGDPADWKFWQLVRVAEKLGILTTTAITQVRLAEEYRNLIHPGRSLQRGERCGKDTALGALSALERVIRELSEDEANGTVAVDARTTNARPEKS